jgi:cation diffusion facilitator CzcD-associated flavoprotein CzcO
VVKHLSQYASVIGATVRLGTNVTRLAATDEDLVAHADGTTFRARNVVLATGPYPRPKIPAAAEKISGHIRQLHSNDYRRPGQLADGAVLVVGSGQSGVQIAEELHQAGREVHLAVSKVPAAPRRYRGRDAGGPARDVVAWVHAEVGAVVVEERSDVQPIVDREAVLGEQRAQGVGVGDVADQQQRVGHARGAQHIARPVEGHGAGVDADVPDAVPEKAVQMGEPGSVSAAHVGDEGRAGCAAEYLLDDRVRVREVPLVRG